MKKNTLIGFLAVWAGFSSVGSAQMSTFPTPPPLTPRSNQGSEPATNGPSSAFPSPPPLAPSPPPLTPSPEQGSEPATNGPSDVSNVPPPGTMGDTTGGAARSGAASSPLSPSNTPATNILNTTPISASTLNSMTVLDDKVILEAGDRISFRVIEDRDEAVPRLVTDTGEVDFPYIGRLKVAGLTCRQVAQQLKKLLEVDYYKRATVIVGLDIIVGHLAEATQQTAQVAWIVGQVRQVGPQQLPKLQPLTVSQVILRAGGFGDFADERRVRVVHRTTAPSSSGKTTGEIPNADSAPEGQVVDVKSVFEGHSTVDPIVQPNDLIIVPKRLINF